MGRGGRYTKIKGGQDGDGTVSTHWKKSFFEETEGDLVEMEKEGLRDEACFMGQLGQDGRRGIEEIVVIALTYDQWGIKL